MIFVVCFWWLYMLRTTFLPEFTQTYLSSSNKVQYIDVLDHQTNGADVEQGGNVRLHVS